jgi:ubiquinone/menaquinone biosynthesis C-methylase UbiE
LGEVAFPYATYFNGKVINYLKCTICGTICVDPLPKNSDLELIYSQENYHDSHYLKLNLDVHRRSICTLQKRIGNVKGFTLLDFGCGNGAFMLAAREFGCECVGVEFSQSTIDKAADNSGCVVSRFDALKATEQKFDVIHIGHVLEHVVDPASTVTDLLPFLKPSGVLFIEGPLESNPSPARFVAITIGYFKKALLPNDIAKHVPYHLTMTNKKSQLNFFVDRLKLECVYFSIEDTGSAYFHGNTKTIAGCTKRIIALFSIALSKIYPKFGDVFLAVLRPLK